MTEYQKMKEKYRTEAIDWQRSFANKSYYWSEIAEMSNHFETVGRRYGLLKEFRENGII